MLNSTLSDKGVFRVKDWWHSKAALLMGMVYLFTAWFDIGFEQFLFLALLSIVTISGFASLGYLINDFFDRKRDEKAGKKNFLTGKSKPVIACCFLTAMFLLVIPWKWLPFDEISALLIIGQICLFAVYSAPPIRLKEKGISGLLVDALYAHALPVILAAYTFSLASEKTIPLLPALMLFAWQTMSGVRNILLHQFDDLKWDEKAGAQNYVSTIFPEPFYTSIRNLIAAELVFSLVFFGILLIEHRIMAAGVIVIAALSAAALIIAGKDIPRFLESKWKFFPNNVYEKWLPPSLLAAMSYLLDEKFAITFIVHLLLFNLDFIIRFFQALRYFANDLLEIVFKPVYRFVFITASNAVFQLCKRVFYLIKGNIHIASSFLVNYLIYYGFLVFGVDLRKENTSALDYLKKPKKARKGLNRHETR